MHMKHIRYNLGTLFLVPLLFVVHATYPVVVGSESAISVESLVVFPAADSNNTILGFARMQNGFTLEDAATTCTFNAQFPVSGPITLNDGVFHLQRGMVLSDVASLTSLGDVYGHGLNVELSPLMSVLGGSTTRSYVFDNVHLVTNSNITLNSSITFQGNSCINCKNGQLTLGTNGEIIVAAGSTLTLRNMTLQGLSGVNVRCEAADSVLVLDDIDWAQDADYTFAQGSFRVRNYVAMYGNSSFSYTSTQQSTVQATSRLELDVNFTFSYAPADSTDQDLLAFIDETSELMLDGATVYANQNGLTLTKGTLIVKSNAYLQALTIDGVITAGITLGNSIEADDMKLVILNGNALSLNQGSLHYKNVAATALEMANTRSRMVFQNGTTLLAYEDINLGVGSLEFYGTTGLVLATGKQIIGSIKPFGTLQYGYIS